MHCNAAGFPCSLPVPVLPSTPAVALARTGCQGTAGRIQAGSVVGGKGTHVPTSGASAKMRASLRGLKQARGSAGTCERPVRKEVCVCVCVCMCVCVCVHVRERACVPKALLLKGPDCTNGNW